MNHPIAEKGGLKIVRARISVSHLHAGRRQNAAGFGAQSENAQMRYSII
jgi:hypothetical protein